MYKDLIWTKLFCDVLSFPNSCCILSEMSKILFARYFSPSRTNYKFVTPLSIHQNNNYSHIYWIITFKIIDQSSCKTDQPKPGPFSLTIQPRKQKALGTRLFNRGLALIHLWTCAPWFVHERVVSPWQLDSGAEYYTEGHLHCVLRKRLFVMIRHSASTLNRSSNPLEISKMALCGRKPWNFQGGVYFCLGYLPSDESWAIALTQKTMEMSFCVVFCDSGTV
jgi:hypothetical protein